MRCGGVIQRLFEILFLVWVLVALACLVALAVGAYAYPNDLSTRDFLLLALGFCATATLALVCHAVGKALQRLSDMGKEFIDLWSPEELAFAKKQQELIRLHQSEKGDVVWLKLKAFSVEELQELIARLENRSDLADLLDIARQALREAVQ